MPVCMCCVSSMECHLDDQTSPRDDPRSPRRVQASVCPGGELHVPTFLSELVFPQVLLSAVTRHTRRIFLMPANSSFPIVRLCAVLDSLLILYQIQRLLVQMRFCIRHPISKSSENWQ